MTRSVGLVVALIASAGCSRDGPSGGNHPHGGGAGDLRSDPSNGDDGGTPGGEDAAVTSGMFSCDVTTGGVRSCTDYSWSGSPFDGTSLAAGCAAGGGTAVALCNHAGAIGGCKIVSSIGDLTLVATAWAFSGTVDSYKETCADSKGTFVLP